MSADRTVADLLALRIADFHRAFDRYVGPEGREVDAERALVAAHDVLAGAEVVAEETSRLIGEDLADRFDVDDPAGGVLGRRTLTIRRGTTELALNEDDTDFLVHCLSGGNDAWFDDDNDEGGQR